MKRFHYIVGLVGVLSFILSGQVLLRHQPSLSSLEPGIHMMYVSRHIYVLGASLVNLALGLYFRNDTQKWRYTLQAVGSILLMSSPFLLVTAFLVEPSLGLAGRSWWSRLGLFTLLAGMLGHLIASVGNRKS